MRRFDHAGGDIGTMIRHALQIGQQVGQDKACGQRAFTALKSCDVVGAKLALELNGENEELKRVYTEIGRLYYEQAKDAPEGFFAPLFAQAEEICGRIAAKEDEINALKADVAAATGCDEADIDVEIGEFDDFDNIVDATEDDGKNE